MDGLTNEGAERAQRMECLRLADGNLELARQLWLWVIHGDMAFAIKPPRSAETGEG